MSIGMAVEVPLLGIALLWLAALIPAAVVCVLRQEWAGFLAGWLTFGLAWIACAAAFIPRRYALRAVILSVAAVVVLGTIASRPTPILGLDGHALDSSVGGGGIYLQSMPCEHLEASSWTCGRYEAAASSNLPYRVEVDRLGCWEARREWHDRPVGRVRYSGCVSIIDNLF